MCVPMEVQNCPRGLECLTTLDQLMIMQKVNIVEAIFGFEANNKYFIRNNLGQNVSDLVVKPFATFCCY